VPYSRIHGSQQGLYLVHLALARVKTVIQPNGSINDEEVIAVANEHGIAMVFTGMRAFQTLRQLSVASGQFPVSY
jgi:hypothetical protein